MSDPHHLFAAPAADVVGVALLVVGVVMILSMILMPLGIGLVGVGTLSLMRGLHGDEGDSTPPKGVEKGP